MTRVEKIKLVLEPVDLTKPTQVLLAALAEGPDQYKDLKDGTVSVQGILDELTKNRRPEIKWSDFDASLAAANAAKDGVSATFQLVSNGMDAVLERVVHTQKIIGNDLSKCSPEEVAAFLDFAPEDFTKYTNQHSDDLAWRKKVRQHCVLTLYSGDKPDPKGPKTIEIWDAGIGIQSEEMREILFKIGQTTKAGKRYQLGRHGFGALQALFLCDGMLIRSRHYDSDRVAITVTRRIDDDDGYSRFQILTDIRGQIPSIPANKVASRKPGSLVDQPQKDSGLWIPTWETELFPIGTQIKVYNLDMGAHNAVASHANRPFLRVGNTMLPRPPIPLHTVELRGWGQPTKVGKIWYDSPLDAARKRKTKKQWGGSLMRALQYTIRGASYQFDWNSEGTTVYGDNMPPLIIQFHSSLLDKNVQCAVRPYILRRKDETFGLRPGQTTKQFQGKKEKGDAKHVLSNNRNLLPGIEVLFTHKGTLHGSLRFKQFFVGRSQLDALGDRLAVTIELSGLPPRLFEDLSLASRGQIRTDTLTYTELRDAVRDALTTNSRLLELNAAAIKNVLDMACVSDTKKFQASFNKLWKAIDGKKFPELVVAPIWPCGPPKSAWNELKVDKVTRKTGRAKPYRIDQAKKRMTIHLSSNAPDGHPTPCWTSNVLVLWAPGSNGPAPLGQIVGGTSTWDKGRAELIFQFDSIPKTKTGLAGTLVVHIQKRNGTSINTKPHPYKVAKVCPTGNDSTEGDGDRKDGLALMLKNPKILPASNLGKEKVAQVIFETVTQTSPGGCKVLINVKHPYLRAKILEWNKGQATVETQLLQRYVPRVAAQVLLQVLFWDKHKQTPEEPEQQAQFEVHMQGVLLGLVTAKNPVCSAAR